MSLSLDTLNPAQRAAAEHVEGPLLILAGAGSGKTRVLTQRIAKLIHDGHAFPGEIFAVTFTNKAAKEMLERVELLLQSKSIPTRDLWISTFHSSGARILREHGEKLGLGNNFSILDNYDQQSLIKDCLKDLDISDKVLHPKSVLAKINSLKNEALDPAAFVPSRSSFYDTKIAPLLHLYEKRLFAANAVDFGDLLLKSYTLLRDHKDILEMYQDRFRFVMVDEYQDTNIVQYLFLKLLCEKYNNLCVVGDEDQSIYKWRGADIRNILDFEKDYPNAKVVKLEENYRSTGHIIRAANTVISNNTQRKDKNLFTSHADGDPVELHYLGSDLEEARWLAKQVGKIHRSGGAFKDMVILYRTHAQSRLLEDSLRYERFNYKIYGGLKFYERAEIKDAIAFLRLLVNPKDDISFYRIINVPTRGIGKQTIDDLRSFSMKEDLSAVESLSLICTDPSIEFKPAAKKKLRVFLDLYSTLISKYGKMEAAEFYAWMLDETGYVAALEKEDTIESASRIDNLKELASAISEFQQKNPEAGLEAFLQEIALFTDQDKGDSTEECITLMTMHSAKGLEFPYVFVVGLEEGLFPSIRKDDSQSESDAVEEERRLCYVAMTRAMKKLFLSSARFRRVFGVTQVQQSSRFLDELPQDEIRIVDHAPRRQKPSWQEGVYDNDWDDFSQVENSVESQLPGDELQGALYPLGSKVRHPNYGEGVIVKREGVSSNLKLSVRFMSSGVKKFVARYAPLEML